MPLIYSAGRDEEVGLINDHDVDWRIRLRVSVSTRRRHSSSRV